MVIGLCAQSTNFKDRNSVLDLDPTLKLSLIYLSDQCISWRSDLRSEACFPNVPFHTGTFHFKHNLYYFSK